MDNSKRVSVETMTHSYNCFKQSPLIQMCRQMIHNQLLNNGVKLSQGSSKTMKIPKSKLQMPNRPHIHM